MVIDHVLSGDNLTALLNQSQLSKYFASVLTKDDPGPQSSAIGCHFSHIKWSCQIVTEYGHLAHP